MFCPPPPLDGYPSGISPFVWVDSLLGIIRGELSKPEMGIETIALCSQVSESGSAMERLNAILFWAKYKVKIAQFQRGCG